MKNRHIQPILINKWYPAGAGEWNRLTKLTDAATFHATTEELMMDTKLVDLTITIPVRCEKCGEIGYMNIEQYYFRTEKQLFVDCRSCGHMIDLKEQYPGGGHEA